MIFMLCVAGIYLCSMFFLLLRLVIGLIHIVVVSSHLMSCSIIPEDFKSAGHFPSSDSVKSRFKAIFKKWPSWIRRCCFSWIFAPGGRLNHEAYNVRPIKKRNIRHWDRNNQSFWNLQSNFKKREILQKSKKMHTTLGQNFYTKFVSSITRRRKQVRRSYWCESSWN